VYFTTVLLLYTPAPGFRESADEQIPLRVQAAEEVVLSVYSIICAFSEWWRDRLKKIHPCIWTLFFLTCKHMHTCIHAYIHVYTHAYAHSYIHTYIHTYIHVYIYVYVIHVRIYMYVYTYKYLCICIHIYVYIGIHIYIHTYANTFISTCIHKKTCMHTQTYVHTGVHKCTRTHTESQRVCVHVCVWESAREEATKIGIPRARKRDRRVVA